MFHLLHYPIFRNAKQASVLSTLAAFVTTTAMEPQVNQLPRTLYKADLRYSSEHFNRDDERDDAEWYSQPRFVQHIGDSAVETLRAYYSTQIQESDRVLDLCSSWTSHLPTDFRPKSVTGYGMNDAEMRANRHLTSYHVKDLNKAPSLSEIGDAEVDVVICSVSVDYLTQPLHVFREIGRCLKKGGTAHMAFSNRCFPTKVIRLWLRMSDEERRRWIGGYFWESGLFVDVEEVILQKGGLSYDPMYIVRGVRA
ncbi:hypothetical protein PVAG01_04627 [Phlyctema vagabunda]|uniref:Methyltransferase type 11 domain-containing protein n=1 Tax=Phlyctema vagabunda TaxID=108571 RepID=A0ABR4PHR6_9HELO